MKLGNTAIKPVRTFPFNKSSLLVGFYGTRSASQINSLGVIYFNSTCFPSEPDPVVPVIVPIVTPPVVVPSTPIVQITSGSKLAIAILASVLFVLLFFLCFLWRFATNKKTEANSKKVTPDVENQVEVKEPS